MKGCKRCRDSAKVQRWCRGAEQVLRLAEVILQVQRWCRGGAEQVQRWCRGGAEVVQSRCRAGAEQVCVCVCVCNLTSRWLGLTHDVASKAQGSAPSHPARCGC
jgi:hypothetical protein